jgi:ethanolamine utilization protein EutJ
MSLILMRRYGLTYPEAEAFKQDPQNSGEVLAVVGPVAEKMAGIVSRHIRGYDVGEAWLVGGTASLSGMENIFSDILGIQTNKPPHPMLVTPLGIALSCAPEAGGIGQRTYQSMSENRQRA